MTTEDAAESPSKSPSAERRKIREPPMSVEEDVAEYIWLREEEWKERQNKRIAEMDIQHNSWCKEGEEWTHWDVTITPRTANSDTSPQHKITYEHDLQEVNETQTVMESRLVDQFAYTVSRWSRHLRNIPYTCMNNVNSVGSFCVNPLRSFWHKLAYRPGKGTWRRWNTKVVRFFEQETCLMRVILLIPILLFLGRLIIFYLLDERVHVKGSPFKCGMECDSERMSVTEDGLAFITSGLSKCSSSNSSGIYSFDLHKPMDSFVEMKFMNFNFSLESFVPYAIDILTEKSDDLHLYIVNHDKISGQSIDLFTYDRKIPDELRHVSRINDKKFRFLSDITLVDKEEFYLTNLWKYPHVYSYIWERLIPVLRSSNVLHVKKGNVTEMRQNGYLYNSAALSKNKKNLFVNLMGSGIVNIYKRDESSGVLSFDSALRLGFNSDHVYSDKKSGSMYVGSLGSLVAHKLYQTFTHKKFNGSTARTIVREEGSTLHEVGREIFHTIKKGGFAAKESPKSSSSLSSISSSSSLPSLAVASASVPPPSEPSSSVDYNSSDRYFKRNGSKASCSFDCQICQQLKHLLLEDG